VRQDASRFAQETEQRRVLWLLDLAIAISSVLASLQIAHYLLVARPLAHLLAALRRMENGYWGRVEAPGGAWEFRWLAYRFQRLGERLEHTLLRLVEAERRGLQGAGSRAEDSALGIGNGLGGRDRRGQAVAETAPPAPTSNEANRLLLEYLMDQCVVLETQNPQDPRVRACAEEVWNRAATEAERLGNKHLRNRLEDAALRVLDPAAWDLVSRGVAAMTESHTDWFESRESEIRSALLEAHVPYLDLQRRTKHVAAIWRKMRSKDLVLEQVQDIFGFRVIVDDETECYRALETLHRRYRPYLLRFKDYIASPKANGYQSLHTSVRAEDGVEFEIQVRTSEMHRHANSGLAAHWLYKSDGAAAAVASRWQRLRENLRRARRGVRRPG